MFPDYCSWISDFVTSHYQLVNKSEIIFIPNGGFEGGFRVYCSVLSVWTFHQHKLESIIFIGRKYLQQSLGKFAVLCCKLISSPKIFNVFANLYQRWQTSVKPLLLCQKLTKHLIMFAALLLVVANIWQTPKNCQKVTTDRLSVFYSVFQNCTRIKTLEI